MDPAAVHYRVAPIDPAALQTLSPEVLTATRFHLAPSIRLVRSDWPIHAIWRFNMEDGAPKPEMAAEDTLIARPDMDPAPHLLPPGGGAFIDALIRGATFGDAMECAAKENEAFDLTQVLTLLISLNAIVNLGD